MIFSGTVIAQSQAKKVVADKIAAIVGDRIILQSDIKNSIADITRQGGTVPENAQCMLMEQAVVSKVLMLQAEKDSLPVSDEEVEAELDQKIRYYINQLGTQEALEQVAGKTIYQIKDDARESVKEQKLAAANIKVYGFSGKAKNAVASLLAGTLEGVKSCAGHSHGEGHSCGHHQ